MASRISPWVILPPMIFLTIAATFLFGLNRSDPDTLPSALIGKEAPALQTTAIADLPPFTAEALRTGDIKLVNFWASWCGPCRIEHPNLQSLADAGVPIYGLNYKDSETNALAFLQELGNPYTAVSAIDGRQALEWGVYGIPETFIIGPNGQILDRSTGTLTQRIITEKVIPLLGNSPKK